MCLDPPNLRKQFIFYSLTQHFLLIKDCYANKPDSRKYKLFQFRMKLRLSILQYRLTQISSVKNYNYFEIDLVPLTILKVINYLISAHFFKIIRLFSFDI